MKQLGAFFVCAMIAGVIATSGKSSAAPMGPVCPASPILTPSSGR